MTARPRRFALNPRLVLRGFALIGALVALGFFLEETRFGAAINEAWIDREVRGHGFSGEILFVAAAAVFTAVGLPRQLISFLGGYAFGFLLGTLLATLATVASCVATFLYARLLGRGPIAQRFGGRIRRVDEFLRAHPFSMTLLVRLLPVGNNLVTNLAAGVTSVRAAPFFAGSAIGYVPQTAAFALIGSGVNLDPVLRIGLGAVLFVASGAIGVWLYRKYRRSRALDAEIARELEAAKPARGRRPTQERAAARAESGGESP